MKIVFVNGCFDILHRGHLELFRHAASLGDKLVVGIDSDTKIKADKGEARPINTQRDRHFILSCIRYIDQVEIFETPEELVNLVQETAPDIMIVGSDWKGKHIVGGEYAGEIRYFEKIDGYSTSQIVETLSNR